MADKYDVKQYVANIVGKEYVVPTLKVYDKVEEIRYEELPNQFVIKCTHDSGSTFVCRKKEDFEWKKVKKSLKRACSKNYFFRGREWPYKYIKPRIIVEPLLLDTRGGVLLIINSIVSMENHNFCMYQRDWTGISLQELAF